MDDNYVIRLQRGNLKIQCMVDPLLAQQDGPFGLEQILIESFRAMLGRFLEEEEIRDEESKPEG